MLTPRYRVLHLPSQTNHAFQDIWRQLANYWRALAPERQLGQPGSNSASMEQNMFIIRLKICSGYSGPGLCWVSWWHWDVGQGPGHGSPGQADMMIGPWRWHRSDDTHDRWHNVTTTATLSFCLKFPFSVRMKAVPLTICLAPWLGTVSGVGVKWRNGCFRQKTEINQPESVRCRGGWLARNGGWFLSWIIQLGNLLVIIRGFGLVIMGC